MATMVRCWWEPDEVMKPSEPAFCFELEQAKHQHILRFVKARSLRPLVSVNCTSRSVATRKVYAVSTSREGAIMSWFFHTPLAGSCVWNRRSLPARADPRNGAECPRELSHGFRDRCRHSATPCLCWDSNPSRQQGSKSLYRLGSSGLYPITE